MRVGLGVAVAALVGGTQPAVASEDAQLAAVDEFLDGFERMLADGNRAELPAAILRAAKLHDSIENGQRRAQLRAALSDVVESPGLNWAHRDAVLALLGLNDPKAGFRRLREHLPKNKKAPLSEAGLVVLQGLEKRPVDAAVSPLRSTAQSTVPEARAAAIAALGSYGKSEKREAVLKFLVARLTKLELGKHEPLYGPWLGEWLNTAPPLLVALQRLTGRKCAEPAVWIDAYKQNRRELGVLFDPKFELPPFKPPSSGSWAAARAELGRPDEKVRESVEKALGWLARHQEPGGAFRAEGFGERCRAGDRCAGPGLKQYKLGVTALAAQAFLVAGYDGSGKHAFDTSVRKALVWMTTQQDEKGHFVTPTDPGALHTDCSNLPFSGIRGLDGKWIARPRRGSNEPVMGGFAGPYAHAIATLAFVEAFGLTGNAKYRSIAQRGLDFIAYSRNPNLAWRYRPRGGENDTSVTAWQAMALCVARMVNAAAVRAGAAPPFTVDEAAIDGARAWIKKMSDPEFGQVGYNVAGGAPMRPKGLHDKYPPEKSQAMTAAGICVLLYSGEIPRRSKPILMGAALCYRAPEWNDEDGSIDMYYWHLGSLAIHGIGGSSWKRWNEALQKSLLAYQRQDGCESGSWGPIGAWGSQGGRVYSTALNTLTLLTAWRYPSWDR